MSAKPWAESHALEMRIAFRALADKFDLDGERFCALLLSREAYDASQAERYARVLLGKVSVAGHEADAILRRVRCLAEGRLVRDEHWKIRVPRATWYGPYHSHEEAREDFRSLDLTGTDRGARIVRVTRIRRAS